MSRSTLSILFYPGTATSSRGGARDHVQGMTRALRSKNCDVEILAALAPGGSTVVRKILSAAEELVVAPCRVVYRIVRSRPNVLYTRIGVSNVALAIIGPIARLAGTAVVGELNGSPLAEFHGRSKRLSYFSSAMQRFLRRQYLTCDAVRTVSGGLAELARSSGATNVVHIPNGSDVNPVALPSCSAQTASAKQPEADSPHRHLRAGFAGVDAPWYELDLWETVMRQDPNLTMFVATDERSEAGIRARASDLVATGQLVLTGWLTESEMVSMLAGCDVAVLPLRRLDPPDLRSPLKLYTYLRLPVPVMANISDGVPSSLEDVGVVFYEPGDPSDLAESIAYVRCNLDEVVRLAKQRDPHSYSWDARAQTLLSDVLLPLCDRAA